VPDKEKVADSSPPPFFLANQVRSGQKRRMACHTTSTVTASTTATSKLQRFTPVPATWPNGLKIQPPATAHHAEDDVQQQACAGLVDDLAGDQSRQEARNDPG
jgi:hypothetical protein